jgi:protein SCO1
MKMLDEKCQQKEKAESKSDRVEWELIHFIRLIPAAFMYLSHQFRRSHLSLSSHRLAVVLVLPPCLCIFAAVAMAGCNSSRGREYPIEGQIIGLQPDRQEVLLKHKDIKGFMPAMTMPFKVLSWREVEATAPGDLVTATLVVDNDQAYLKRIKKTGSAPLDVPPPAPEATSGFELLEPGQRVPDQTFIDENGKSRRLSEFKGRALAITFIYTRCPIPTFCPMMDRHFAAIQKNMNGGLRERAHLLSISFDPAYDTPSVLKRHAAALGADPAVWNFLTGDRDEIDRFAMRFGVSITREGSKAEDIAHNLRTVIVDQEGKLVKVYTGVEWTPAQVERDLEALTQS